MSRRDRFMRGLLKAQMKSGNFPDQSGEAPTLILTDAARLSLLFDGIKLIGTGNGAGALAAVAAINYLSSHSELRLPLKAAAVLFLTGCLIFALTIVGYILGLSATTSFVEKQAKNEAGKIPSKEMNKAIDGLMLLLFSLIGAIASLSCFFVGTSIGLYAILKL